jgi:signal transduction histidine kinase
MTFLNAIALFGFVIGIVLQLSLFVLIRRYRRIEKLEILFLSLISCLFLWNTCRFLFLVFQITEFKPLNAILFELAVALPSFCVLALLPSLLLHTHLVFQARFTKEPSRLHAFWEIAVYLPLVAFPWALKDFFPAHTADQSILATTDFAQPFAAWFALALIVSAFIDWRMMLQTQRAQLRSLFRALIIIFVSIAALILYSYFVLDFRAALAKGGVLETLLMLWSTVPCALIGYYIFQYNFLEIAIQRSFGYTFVGVLLLLVYLLCVNSLKEVLQSQYRLPGIVIEDALVLALLGFAQPVKRWIDRAVNALFSLEVSKFEAIASRLDNVSRSTVEMEKLLRYVEELLTKELNLKVAKIVLFSPGHESQTLDPRAASSSSSEGFESLVLSTAKGTLGEIRVQSRSGKVSAEQQAALRFLVTQIVAAIENCQMTEGKIRLERDLKDQEKMADLGRIIAAVAHNVKNPLSSIKTIVQLMLEDRDFTQKYDRDLNLISGEIDRLTKRVEDVLKFRTVLPVNVDLAELLEKMVLLFRPETERRGIRLELELSCRPLTVRGTEEIFSEVFQNFIVNAWDVAPEKSRIGIRAQVLGEGPAKAVSVRIEDEGPGIPPRIRQQIFDPFFSTKAKGAGLGLHIVQRRILDLGGEVECVSPVANGRGTRFEIVLPFENTGAIQSAPL